MAGIAVGKKVKYEYKKGSTVPAWVVAYEAGKPSGDHFIAGFCNQEQKDGGSGDVFSLWSVVGKGQGSFSV